MDMPQEDWPHRRVVLLRCTSQLCEQGRRQCPTPTACEVSTEEAEWERRSMQALVLWLAVLLVVAGFLVGSVFFGFK